MLPKLVILSIKMGLVPAVRTWLNHHPAEIDSTDAKGNTLLHYAVLSGNSGLCSMLLDEYGANPHIANIDGNTAIEMAGEQQSDLFHLFKIFEQSTDDAAHESIQADVSWEEEFFDSPSLDDAENWGFWEENAADIISSENDEQLIKEEQFRQSDIGRSRHRTDMEEWYFSPIEEYHFRERKFINEEDESLFISLVSLGHHQGWILRDFLEYFSFFPPEEWEGAAFVRTAMLGQLQNHGGVADRSR